MDAINTVNIITICATESEHLSHSTINSPDKLENKRCFSFRNHKAVIQANFYFPSWWKLKMIRAIRRDIAYANIIAEKYAIC